VTGSLLELLVTAAIALMLTGALSPLVNPAHGLSAVQPEISDMQQRLRITAHLLYRHLVMAGAGVYHGIASGPLNSFFAPVLPYRAGRVGDDPARGTRFRPDAITFIYVPATAAQASAAQPISSGSGAVSIVARAGCAAADAACGFARGMAVVAFDDSTSWDSFQVTAADGSVLQIEQHGESFSRPYAAGATIAQIERHTYYFDTDAGQLRHYDGFQTDSPVADNIVDFRLIYFGTPEPPALPRPPPGEENCVIDAAGVPKLPSLGAGGSLVELNPSLLADGGAGSVQWCGANGNVFDPDLLRVRKIRVTLRVQAGPASLRGSDTVLFRNPGQARPGDRFLPDAQVVFDVTPRNLTSR
jgi:hypothetical protein